SDGLRAFRRLGRAEQAINAIRLIPWSQRRCLNGAQIAEPNPNIGASKRDQSWPRQLIPQLRTLFGTRGVAGSNPLAPTIKVGRPGRFPTSLFLSYGY